MADAVLSVIRTAQMVRAVIASAVDGADVVGYCSCVLPEAREGRISVTVVGSLGRKRMLTYLLGDRSQEDVEAFNPGPDHDVHVISDVVDAQHITAHVREWLDAA